MSDYTQTADFSAKDSLNTGDPNKLIKGSDFDTEFAAIATAITSKYDSNDIASIAQAQAESSNATLITPSRLGSWSDANAGMVGDIHGLADPGADRVLGWDDSAGAVIGFAAGTGLAFSTTNLTLSHLGIESLSDPGADALAVWDDSAGAFAFAPLASESGLAVSATPDITIDISSLSSSLDGTGIAGADLLLIDDGAGGTNKKVAYQDFGMPTTSDATTSIAPAITDANRMFITTNASAVAFVIPANASVAFPIGTTFVIYQSGAGQVTVSVTSDTLRSPNGALTASQYAVITVVKVAATEWVVFGDTSS